MSRKQRRKRKTQRGKKRKVIQETVKYLIRELKKEGITIQRYDSYSSNSVYLKLDYGVLNSIRISDHEGKRYLMYRYNILTHRSKYSKTTNKSRFGAIERFFYPIRDSENLLRQIRKDRNIKINNYGRRNYEMYMKSNIAKSSNENGFWRQAKIV